MSRDYPGAGVLDCEFSTVYSTVSGNNKCYTTYLFCHEKCVILSYYSICIIFARGDWKETSASKFNSKFHQLKLWQAEDDFEFES